MKKIILVCALIMQLTPLYSTYGLLPAPVPTKIVIQEQNGKTHTFDITNLHPRSLHNPSQVMLRDTVQTGYFDQYKKWCVVNGEVIELLYN